MGLGVGQTSRAPSCPTNPAAIFSAVPSGRRPSPRMCEWAAVRFSREPEPLLTSDIVTIGEVCCGDRGAWMGREGKSSRGRVGVVVGLGIA